MAGEARGTSSDLGHRRSHTNISDLVSNGSAYDYFQAIRLLRRHLQDMGCQENGDNAIRVRPALNLSFPAADIEKIDAREQDNLTRYEVTTNFLGLYGTSSPLPTFYSEELIEEAGEDESVSREFIDIFHQRLYDLLFQGWMKYRQFLQVVEEKNEAYIERLYCLLGLGTQSVRREIPDVGRLLRYIGLFTQIPRSSAGLVTLLSDSMPDIPIALVPCVLRKATIPIPQRMSLGMTGSALGTDCYVGEEIEDRMGKFRIRIGPLTRAEFNRFTPGTPDYNRLISLTDLYLTEPLEYEIELVLKEKQAQTMCLGEPERSTLGVSGWIFSEPSLGEVRTRFAVT